MGIVEEIGYIWKSGFGAKVAIVSGAVVAVTSLCSFGAYAMALLTLMAGG